MAYIYKITNLINQKSYIGKTEYNPPERRWRQHQQESKKDRSKHRALYKAINKYGLSNFVFEVIEETMTPNEREQYYIQYYDTFHHGYNETLGGDGTAYLELPEKEICAYYLVPHTLKETASFFNHDKETIKKVLYKNNISLHSNQEIGLLKKSYTVAKINPKTNEIIQIYPSIQAAEQDNGNTRHIADVIHGKRKTCKGFIWKKI